MSLSQATEETTQGTATTATITTTIEEGTSRGIATIMTIETAAIAITREETPGADQGTGTRSTKGSITGTRTTRADTDDTMMSELTLYVHPLMTTHYLSIRCRVDQWRVDAHLSAKAALSLFCLA